MFNFMKMKKITILALMLSMMIACAKEEEPHSNPMGPTGPTGLTEEIYYEEVGEVESIGLMEHYELLIQDVTADNAEENAEANAAFLEYLQEQLATAEEYTQECIDQSGANWSEGSDGETDKNRLLGYEYATIRYKSIDHKGNPIILSTLVVWPYNIIFSNPDPNNVIIGCHVTIGSNAERPTNYSKQTVMSDIGMLACCAKSNNIGTSGIGSSAYENLVIIPDYQGFGATHGDVHPYLSQDLTARQVLDGVRAGIAYYTKKKGTLEKDWRSVSTGYSQGGSVAMAVHRYIERNNLENEFNFAGSVCGSGPYDPIATIKTYLNTDYTYMPVAAAMMLYSMVETNPRLMGKYKVGDFLSKKFIDSGIIDLIKSKTLNTDQIQEELLEYSAKFNNGAEEFCMERKDKKDEYFYPYRKDTKDKHEWADGYIKTARANTHDLLEYYTNSYFWTGGVGINGDYTAAKALYAALEDNILYRNWNPAHPIFLYHTEDDEVVVIDNYHNCMKAWKDSNMVKGTIYKGNTKTHVSYGSYFYMLHCGEGIKAIFDNKVDKYPHSRIDRGDI